MAHTKKHHHRRPPVDEQLAVTDRIGALLSQAERDGIPEGLEGSRVTDELNKGDLLEEIYTIAHERK